MVLAETDGEGINMVKPIALTIIAMINPAIGPSAPTSNNASLLGGRDF